MIDYDKQEKESLVKVMAALDSIIMSAREQQIVLGKILARNMGLPEDSLLNALKEASVSLLIKNGLDY